MLVEARHGVVDDDHSLSTQWIVMEAGEEERESQSVTVAGAEGIAQICLSYIARQRSGLTVTTQSFFGSRRLLAHSVITPKQPGWMEEVDKAIEVYKPDSWKSYTIGDPLAPSKFPWRLDDEQVMYPFYEKAVKAGINTLCIHKG